MEQLPNQPKTNKAFTLIELLVVIVILGILSSIGIISYNNYLESSRERVTEENYNKIIDTMNTELLRCKLNNSDRIFDSHSCESSSGPSINFLSNYFSNNLNIKNPYDKNSSIIGSDVCKKGTIAITSTSTGTYDASYASSKKKKKYSKQITSSWSSNYTKTNTTNISYNCSSSGSSSQGSIANYKVPGGVPHDGFGAYIAVDKDGKMIRKSYSACTYSYCGNEAEKNRTNGYASGVLWNRAEGRNYKPGEVKYVLIQANRGTKPPGTVMNSAVPFDDNGQRICTNKDCTYDFSNNTFKDNKTGKIFEAGSGKIVNP